MISNARVSEMVGIIASTIMGAGVQAGRRIGVVAALALTLLSVGCARVSVPPMEEVGVEKISTAKMLEIMERSYAYVSLQALAEVRLQRGNDKQSSTQALHVQAPFQLRAEVYNFMGQMLVMLIANGADLKAYVPSRNTLYHGMATRERMERFAYVPLMPADMVALLLQRLPPGVLQLAQVHKGAHNTLRFVVSAQQEYVVRFAADQVQRIAYRELGQEVFSIAYADVTPTDDGGEMFPRHMALMMSAQDLELDIELEDVQLNPALEPDLFHMEGRAGVKAVSLEEL